MGYSPIKMLDGPESMDESFRASFVTPLNRNHSEQIVTNFDCLCEVDTWFGSGDARAYFSLDVDANQIVDTIDQYKNIRDHFDAVVGHLEKIRDTYLDSGISLEATESDDDPSDVSFLGMYAK